MNKVLSRACCHGVAAPKGAGLLHAPERTHLIATDRFISALSGSVLKWSPNRAALKVLAVDFPAKAWTVGIMHLKSRTLAPSAKAFMDEIRKVAASFVGP
jgi:hypothetical protein